MSKISQYLTARILTYIIETMSTLKRIAMSLLALFLMTSAFSYSKKDLYNAVRGTNEIQVKKILTVSPELTSLRFDSEGNSILIIALQYGCNDKIIDHILKTGCNVDLKNKMGQSAIMIACMKGVNRKTVKRLIEYNVFTKSGKIRRITEKDKNGKTAFDYSKEHETLYNLLCTYTTDPASIKEEPQSAEPEQEEPQPETPEPQEEQPQEDNSQEIQEEPQEEIPESKEEEPQEIQEPEQAFEVQQEPDQTISEEQILPENETESNISIEETDEIEPLTDTSSVTPLITIVVTEESENEAEETTETEDSSEEQEESPAETDISADIMVPQIDYYNSRHPEYLFDEIETESLVEDEEDLLSEIKDTKVKIISNPDATDNNGRTRLMNAIMENDDRACYALLKSGANPNATDKDGCTPVMYACRYSQTSSTILLLIEYGADLNAKSNYQVSVLQTAAAFCKNSKVLSTILQEAHKQEIDLYPSFITAIKEERDSEIIKEFLKFNLNINALYKGKTPLMYAAENYESTEVIKLLMENGANPYIISFEKKNAFSYAKENSKIIHDSVYWSLNVSSLNKR